MRNGPLSFLNLHQVHRAAAGQCHPTRGLSLRFPRFLRIRDDKEMEDATSADQVAALYRAQARKSQEMAPATGRVVPAAAPLDGSDGSEADEEEDEGYDVARDQVAEELASLEGA